MKRPLSVTLLALGVLSFTGVNCLRFIEVIRQWPLLSSLPLKTSPIFLGLTGLLWTLVGLPIFWGLWRGRPWGARGIKVLMVVYAAIFWIDRLLLVQVPAGGELAFFIDREFSGMVYCSLGSVPETGKKILWRDA